MEFRYYLIMAVSALALQFLLYNFCRTVGWLFHLSPSARKRLTLISYLSANTAMAVHISQIIPLFRTIALLLVLLLFMLFISVACLAIFMVGKRFISAPFLQKGLRLAYPFAFVGLIGVAVWNAYTPKVVHYQIDIEKPLAPLRIGVASDLHLGKWFGNRQLDQLAALFQQEKVDLILIPGDVMDDNTHAFVADNMLPHLAKLHAPLGVFATMGNHDLFGAELAIAHAIRQAGITLLWDQAVVLDGKFAIVGRNDELMKNRPATDTLLQGIDPQLPIFLLDHRPTDITQHAKLPIDLQVSGHTHNGQIFPANFVVKMMYRLAHGYEKIGNGHFFVTSGYGFWGIPMRLGSQSEVMIIDVKGKR